MPDAQEDFLTLDKALEGELQPRCDIPKTPIKSVKSARPSILLRVNRK